MTTQPPEPAPYATAYSLETQYTDQITPAVKILAAFYIAHLVTSKNEKDSPSTGEADLALKISLLWLDRLLALAKSLFSMPHFSKVGDDNFQTFSDTVERLQSDLTAFRASRLPREGADPVVVASQFLLRMQWSLDWVKQHMQDPPPSAATKKIWVSRLDPKTCSVACRKMHGTVVGINESFTSVALDQGVPANLLYGALWGPPIHPNCRCHLIYV